MHVKATLSLLAILAPYHALSNPTERSEPYQQEFLITAYYSPLPGQCCYVMGGFIADTILNGEGHTASDGTAVYPGMIAAPGSYAFGTSVSLPGLGTFTVHDRGGAIVELGSGTHRLDVWAGYGEEGLARALAFGLKRMKGTVYPVTVSQPETSVDLSLLPAPVDELKTYFVEEDNFLALRPKEGERGLSVLLLQEYLHELGYMKKNPTGFFGPETKAAFETFLEDFLVSAPNNELSERAAAYVLGAKKRLAARMPLPQTIDQDASLGSIAEAQRLLRFLGYYRGRTDGKYGDDLFTAILTFQQKHKLVGTAEDNGAGRIGPITSRVLRAEWNRAIVGAHAERYLDVYSIERKISERGQRIDRFLGEGYTGKQVRLLQHELAALGFFPASEINGSFGPLTAESVKQYQLSRRIISSIHDEAAGYVGPETLRNLRKDQRTILYRLVRAEGWKAL